MILADVDILREIKEGNIEISPYTPEFMNPNSYNLRLHDILLVYADAVLDAKKKNRTSGVRIPEEGILLQPGVLYLGSTIESTRTSGNIVPMIEGRSSIARLGICIHLTAGFGDVGFEGNWTLELSVVQVCQIFYTRTETPPERSYQGRYQCAKGVQESKLYEDY